MRGFYDKYGDKYPEAAKSFNEQFPKPNPMEGGLSAAAEEGAGDMMEGMGGEMIGGAMGRALGPLGAAMGMVLGGAGPLNSKGGYFNPCGEFIQP